MEMHLPFQAELLVFLAITAILVPVFSRFRLNPVLGFLLAGVVIGPYGLGRLVGDYPFLSAIVFEDVKGVSILAELGVIFLLFTIGLELSPQRLWAMRRMVFGLGTAQIVVTGAVIGAVAYMWGNSGPASAVIGTALALSSTAMIMKILFDRQQFASPVGQTSFSILLMQDLAVVPLIFMVAMLQDKGAGAEQNVLLSLLLALAKAGGVVAVLVALGHFVVRPALRYVTAGAQGPEFFMAQILLIVICSAWATGEAGLSMALGAFLAGLVLAETEFRNQIEVDIEPFKGMFLGLFFMSVGMGVDLLAVMDNLFWLVASVFGIFAIKAVITAGLCRIWGVSLPTSIQTGLALGQGGEFAFVLFGLAMASGVVEKNVGHFMMMLASLTMILTPFYYRLGEVLAARLVKRKANGMTEVMEQYVKGVEGHVVIAGFGRTGQAVAEVMEHNQIPYVGLDHQSGHLEALRKKGKPVFYGDASQSHVLDKVKATSARAIILAMDDKKASRTAIENIRRHCKNVPIYARARDEAHAADLQRLGVNDVVLETREISLQLAGRVLQCFEYSAAAAGRVLESEREEAEPLNDNVAA